MTARVPLHRCVSVPLLAALMLLGFQPLGAAEDDVTLLTIEGDLVGPLSTLPADSDPQLVTAAYYALLPADLQTELAELQQQLTALVPDYTVAFAAADSAELTEVKSDIDVIWTALHTLHGRYFTRDVVGILEHAYREAYVLIGANAAVISP